MVFTAEEFLFSQMLPQDERKQIRATPIFFTQIMVSIFYELKKEGFPTYEAIAAELERGGREPFYPDCHWTFHHLQDDEVL